MNACDTHEVFNQATPFENVNLFACDPVLQEALLREGGGAASAELELLGERLGSAELIALAHLANVHGPQLRQFDRSGRRIDEVEFHPAWHGLMAVLVKRGPACGAVGGAGAGRRRRNRDRDPCGARRRLYLGRAAGKRRAMPADDDVCVGAGAAPGDRLAADPGALAAENPVPIEYDPRSLPVEHKRGALIGMGMTEKQGGSDVRSNTTRAEALPLPEAQALFGVEADKAYRIVGHKWFFSVPQSDAHLILAQDAGAAGLSCFFLPRYLPDGSRNAIRVQRLKDKLGNRSNASAEVEFAGALWLAGGRGGQGHSTIIEMASHTRLDCVLGSTGIMRAAFARRCTTRASAWRSARRWPNSR